MIRTLGEALATFDYHKPTDAGVEKITVIRNAYKNLVKVIWDQVPDGPDRTVAIRKAHESMMTCNKAIVLEDA
jgi:hypothetical protein